MVRTNCDYIFLQPIYNKTQRDILWDLEAGFMDKNDFSVLMDQIIAKENLPDNTPQDPKKRVQVMVCADFEDSSNPQEKFYFFIPVHLDDLPPFRLCHQRYWDEQKADTQGGAYSGSERAQRSVIEEIHDVEKQLVLKAGALRSVQ